MKFRVTVITLIFLLFLTFSAIFIFAKPQNLLSKYKLFGNYYNNSKLTVASQNGAVEVIVDGESFGDTPVSSVELAQGQHEIVLRKISDEDESSYPDQKIFIDMYENTESVIDIELLPDGSYAGFIIYYTKAPSINANQGNVTLSGAPAEADILFGTKTYKPNEIKNLSLPAKNYEVSIVADGYETLEFPIVISEGYNLNIKVQLLPIPIEL